MAEAAGLVVGVVGLAGLIGAFKDAIDLFNNFADSRELGRDYEILDAKLDIERTILLQWADSVRLLQPDYDSRLDEPHTQQTIIRILACIRLLLDSGSKLEREYGLNEKSALQNSTEPNRSKMLSGSRMDNFLRDFEKLKLRRDIHFKHAPLRKRIRWVIRDKEKFELLVRDLAQFTTKLNQIIPVDRAPASSQSRTNQDVTAIDDLRRLKIILDASVHHRKLIAESTEQHIIRTCQDLILRRLWFRTMEDRKASISAAHSNTLQWALEPPTNDHPWDDLSEWLRTDSEIYWISGKAGSGKSTLMKYLVMHSKTQSLLSSWARDTAISLVHFFFWNLGTTEQKSQEGLSRALLHQILSNNPSLIADVLPNMWKQLRYTDDDIELPSVAETKFAFEAIATKSSEVGKFCFFIDGLDEYERDYLDGIGFIQKLACNKNIKIVVSSRPIPACVAAFDEVPSLQLHHLTRGDIAAYVQDVIGGHKYIRRLISQSPDAANLIMKDVVAKSSGVFLWVILACKSLISGFSDYDRITELRKRVDELPPELHEMFQLMLMKINKRHREQGAKFLRICYTAHKIQGSSRTSVINSIGLAILDDGSINTNEIRSLTNNRKRELCELLDGRLRSRCGGLLELEPRTDYWTDYCFCDPGGEYKDMSNWEGHDSLVDGQVSSIHRTVFEFLSQQSVWELECLNPPEGFVVSTDLSLMALYSAILRSCKVEMPINEFLCDGLNWGAQSDHDDPEGQQNIFWELQPLFDGYLPQEHNMRRLYRMSKHDSNPIASHASLALAIQAGAVNFVRKHPALRHLAQYPAKSCDCDSLLYHTFTHSPFLGKIVDNCSKPMVELLLSSGNDPNQFTIQGCVSPWRAWLRTKAQITKDESALLETAEITVLFLKAGAKIVKGFKDWIENNFLRSPHYRVRVKGSELLNLVSEFKRGCANVDRDIKEATSETDVSRKRPIERETNSSRKRIRQCTTNSRPSQAINSYARSTKKRDL